MSVATEFKRIERWVDGSLRTLHSDAPLVSSAPTQWSGFALERDRCRDGFAHSLVWPHTEVILMASGCIAIEDRALGTRARFRASQGSVTIWPAAHESKSMTWAAERIADAPIEMIAVQLDTAVLRTLAPDTERCAAEVRTAIDDPALAPLLRLMEADIRAGCPTGRLYGECLCQALIAQLFSRRDLDSAAARPRRSVLSKRQVERLRDHVDAHLDKDLSLVDLADVAQVSPQQMTAGFREAFGTTPHQYIVRERVRRAKRLLADPHRSIADVALDLGFASQSHFTTVFRRAVGMTPGCFRQLV